MATSTEDEMNTDSKKWWEQYYVRYFVGTIMGAAIIFALKNNAATRDKLFSFVPSLGEIDAGKLSAVIAAGLAYSYIASAPILTLHSLRGDWGLGRRSPTFWMAAMFCYLITMLAILLPDYVYGGNDSETVNAGWTVGVGLLVLTLALQMTFMFRAAINGFSRIIDFYRRLVVQRRIDKKTGGEFVDSYRHLREHGNAKSIVLFEVILGFILSVARSKTEFVAFIVLWLLPSSLTWLIGNILESDLASRNQT